MSKCEFIQLCYFKTKGLLQTVTDLTLFQPAGGWFFIYIICYDSYCHLDISNDLKFLEENRKAHSSNDWSLTNYKTSTKEKDFEKKNLLLLKLPQTARTREYSAHGENVHALMKRLGSKLLTKWQMIDRSPKIHSKPALRNVPGCGGVSSWKTVRKSNGDSAAGECTTKKNKNIEKYIFIPTGDGFGETFFFLLRSNICPLFGGRQFRECLHTSRCERVAQKAQFWSVLKI